MDTQMIIQLVLAVLVLACLITLTFIHCKDKRTIKVVSKQVETLANSYIKISDSLPRTKTNKAYAMKLADELAKYFVIDEEKKTISLYVYQVNKS